MMLVLDFGNTNQKAAIYDGENLVRLDQYDRLGLLLLKEIFEEFPQIREGIVGSVVHFSHSIKKYLKHRLDFFIELTSRTPIPMINLYKTPGSLGRDRLACAVAASRLFEGTPSMVINAGTCITYDLVNAKNEYLGGAIAPGIRMRLKAMHTFTGKLPLIQLQDPGSFIGSDTEGSMLSGAVNGAVEEVRSMISRYRKIEPNLQVILSGGDMEYLDKRLNSRIFALPNIVIVGLKHILEYNLQYAS